MSWGVIAKAYLSLLAGSQLLGQKASKPLYIKGADAITIAQSTLITRDDVAITADVETTLLTTRNRTLFNALPNKKKISFATLTLSSDGTKDVKIRVYLNGVTGGTYYFWDAANSLVEVSTDTVPSPTITTVGTITKRDEQIGSTLLAKIEKERLNLIEGDITIEAIAGQSITITAESTSASVLSIQLRIKEK